ncbi:MAG: DUF3861 family protein [Proteobacteria bacterium]|nr:MAG: DUF3861 family protein [Pseudomonadota bacterium]
MAAKFRITVERIDGESSAESGQLQFEATNHDDILQIAERVRSKNWLEEADANALAIGLKLFSEVMLKNRSDPLFKELQPSMTKFIAGLKNR